MALNAGAILFQPGDAYVDVTDLSAGAPYGGTAIGHSTSGLLFDPGIEEWEKRGEDFGEALIDKHHMGYNPRALVTLAQFDALALDLAFPSVARNTSNAADEIVKIPGPDSGSGSLPLGTPLSTHARNFLFVPHDSVGAFSIIFHNSIISLARGAQIAWALQKGSTLALVIDPIEDSAIPGGNAAYPIRKVGVGKLSDLSLYTG